MYVVIVVVEFRRRCMLWQPDQKDGDCCKCVFHGWAQENTQVFGFGVCLVCGSPRFDVWRENTT